MKRILFYAIATVFSFSVRAQSKHAFREVLYSGSTAIFFENNFIQNANKVKYQPYDVKRPFKDLYFDVFGSRLLVSAYNLDELMRNGGYSSTGSYRDTAMKDASLFNLNTLEYSITNGNSAEPIWKPAINNPHIDTFHDGYINRNKIFYRQGYLLYDGHLSDGDSLKLSLHKKGVGPFLNIYFRKRSPLKTPPQLMGSYDNHDPDLPLETFVQKALQSYQSWNIDFYQDWPGRNDNGNTRLLPETKTAYYFNPRSSTQNDSLFEYRLIIDKDVSARWKKTANIVFVSGLKAGKQYRLEVRQIDKPQHVFIKKFYVPGYWYHTFWFKWGIIVLVLLTLLTVFYYLKSAYQKKAREEQESKLKALYSQLNPHFIFNALGSIQGLINDGELENANKYLSGFGSLLRTTLESGEKSSISLHEELQNLATYVSLEQLRKAFTYTQNIGEGISLINAKMLPLFFQPIIENAIKHGYREGLHHLNICLSIEKQGFDLQVNVQDDGKGFDTESLHTGKGLSLVAERIHLFNNFSKHEKIIKAISSDRNGTLVSIKFKNWLAYD